jgi:carbonic anhydrase
VKSVTRNLPLLLLGIVLMFALGGVALMGRAWSRRGAGHPVITTPEDALQALRDGNARFMASRRTLSIDTSHDAEERHLLAKGQHPFAAILCCSDSRVCPEFIFDQGPGSLFEIRNAGNVVDDDVMASLEYAVEHLHVRVVLVLGHKGCGAIKAVHDADDKPLHDHLRALQEHMPGIRAMLLATHNDHSENLLDRLALANAREQAASLLKESEPLAVAVRNGEVLLLHRLYDLESGSVELVESP